MHMFRLRDLSPMNGPVHPVPSGSVRRYHGRKPTPRMALLVLLFVIPFLVHAQQKDLNTLMDMSLQDLMEVEVETATHRATPVKQVPAVVRRITASDIRNRGYRTLQDVLSDLPGFQFRDIQGFNSYVFLRGIPNQNNLILLLVDGIQINELNSGGFYGGAQFNLAEVSVIEVVYGPASSLYGTNAVSGVINIITRKPGEDPGVRAGIRAGSFNTTDMHAGWSGSRGELKFRVSAMVNRTDKDNLGGERGHFNWSETMENFEDNASMNATVAYRYWEAGMLVQDKEASRTTNYHSVGTLYRDRDTSWHIRFINAYARYARNLNDRLELNSTFYYRNATVMDDTVGQVLERTGEQGGRIGYYRPNHLAGMEHQLVFSPTERLNIIGGAVYEHESLAERFSFSYSGDPSLQPPTPDAPDMISNSLFSTHIQVEYALTPSVEIMGGIRFDHSSYYGNVSTPRIAVVYNRDRWTHKILYTEAFRAPRPWDYTFGTGNVDLQPEEMKSIEWYAGYRLSDELHLGFSLFRNDLTNVLELQPVDPGPYWVNTGELNTNGLEFEIIYRSHRFQVNASYTWLQSERPGGENIPEIAPHSASLVVQWDLSELINLNLRTHYLGSRINPVIIPETGTNRVPAAWITSCVMTINLNRDAIFQLIGNNIFDTDYDHTSNRPPTLYRQPGRALYISVEYRF